MDAPARPAPVTLRQQIQDLPSAILTAWRTRYVASDDIADDARAILGDEIAAIRAEGAQPDAMTVWISLTDLISNGPKPSSASIAAAALAGLAAGLRPQGFDDQRPVVSPESPDV